MKGKRKNKKGFSLIEVLAVLLVFAIICIIAIPMVRNNVIGTNKKIDETLVISLKNAGQIYSSEFSHDINWKLDEYDNKVSCISIQSLIDKGYIKENSNVDEVKDQYIIKAINANNELSVDLVKNADCDTSSMRDPETDKTMPTIDKATVTAYVYQLKIDLETTPNENLKYYYSLDNITFTESTSNTHTFTNLNYGTEYTIYSYIENELNIKSFTHKEKTKTILPYSTLVINPNGGSWNGTATAQSFRNSVTKTKNVPIPVRTGYRFVKWIRTNTYGVMSSLTGVSTYTYGDTDNVTDTITADWIINTSSLIINPNGGSWNGSTATQTFTQNYNTTKTISVPAKTGYVFNKWIRTNTYGTMTSLTGASTYKYGASHGVTDTLTAEWLQCAARIGSTYYLTIQQALNAVPANNTLTDIYILKSTAESASVAANKNVRINLGGFTITGTLTNSGTLTIAGTGTITNTNSYAILNNVGTVNITGGTIKSTSSYAIMNNSTGTINMTAGTVSSTSSIGIVNNSTGSININYGTVTGGTYGIYSNSSSKVKIGLSSVSYSSSNPNISGGTYGVYMNTSSHYFYFYSGVIKGTHNYPYRGNYSSRTYYYTTSSYSGGKYNATLYYSPPSSGGGSSASYCSSSGSGSDYCTCYACYGW